MIHSQLATGLGRAAARAIGCCPAAARAGGSGPRAPRATANVPLLCRLVGIAGLALPVLAGAQPPSVEVQPGNLPDQVFTPTSAGANLSGTLSSGSGYPYTVTFGMLADATPMLQLTTSLSAGAATLALSTPALLIYGVGATVSTSSKDFSVVNGPDLLLNVLPAYGGGLVVAASFPDVPGGLAGVFTAASFGAGSAPDGTTRCCTQGNGGKVSVEYGANLSLKATSSGSADNAQLFGLAARSVGGYTDAQPHDGVSYGNGGAVYVHTQPGSIIQLNVGGSGATTTYGGVLAESRGFVPTWQDPYSLKDEQQVLGGLVQVVHEGAITGTVTGTATDTTGIVARSLGGSSFGESLNPFYGGNVTVDLKTGSSIALAGPNTTGVLAVSGTYENYAPHPTGGTGPGAVTVNVESGATIATGPGGSTIGQFGFGVQAANVSGIQQVGGIQAMPGNDAGPVSVENAGAITTTGPLAVGIAALSTPLYFTGAAAPGGANYLGSTNTGAGGGNGGAVTVANSGTITTTGGSAFGIFALSGAGGMMSLTQASDDSGSGTTVIGNQYSAFASSGGAVSVTNSGTITTGGTSQAGDGIAAIGILAQSLGGGGGTTGGYHGYFVGDAGGSGGAGGAVAVKTSGASKIVTTGNGAQGILAQSIGGGGGNGASVTGVVLATGGQGGNGGNGGAVDIALAGGGTITTSGHFADGVVGQSIGGGGGNGGASWAYGHAVAVAHGGKAGDGGWGSTVTFDSDNAITTVGDHATGVALQSIGGGGGKGGSAITKDVSVLAVSITVGGAGGGGGDGSVVQATNTGSITTGGNDAFGLLAQSIGGGGGQGGSAVSHSISIPVEEIPALALSTAVGGSGGIGGAGQEVKVTNSGSLTTGGDGAHAVLAQSIGGGGGTGGDSAAAARSFTGGEGGSISMSISLGGGGGDGGAGGLVAITNAGGAITTGGALASAILAQSIGGGGGNGGVGFAKTAGTPVPATGGQQPSEDGGQDEGEAKSYSLAIAIGGAGGAAGLASPVSVANGPDAANRGGSLRTMGSGSYGILAQSIGGGGGAGGGGGTTGGTDIALNIGVGRAGGGGGAGGSVTVTNSGMIQTGAWVRTGNGLTVTVGGDATGILAQSIGGGGGVGGSSDPVAPIAANNAFDDLSKVLEMVQSYDKTPSASYRASVQVGGSGGKGGDGGTVAVANASNATIATWGARAHGIHAQSIGGAGGVGGAAESTPGVDLEAEQEGINVKYTANLDVGGGTAGSVGSGGSVSVTNAGWITTAGYGAVGVLLQSIGGGGGFVAEGTPATHVEATIGSSGSEGTKVTGGNNGGAVTFTDSGNYIATVGDDASAVVAQSIGGGGGIASIGCTNTAGATVNDVHASPCYGNYAMNVREVGAWHDGSLYTVAVQGFAYNVQSGTGINSGGTVTITENGTLITAGARSMGIVAQSIGGGGGLQTMAARNIAQAAVSIDGPPESGSGASLGFPLAGAVKIALGGSVTTSGDGAWGILAQSLGGGGGFVGDPALPLAVQPASKVQIDQDCCQATNNVSISSAGTVVTTGANAHGIVAQSIGGGGGAWVQPAGGGNPARLAFGGVPADPGASYDATGGTITITQSGGVIDTRGAGSIGILAQSAGSLYNQARPAGITITVGGSVSGGSAGGVAVGAVGAGAAGIAVSGGSQDKAHPNLVTVQPSGTVTAQDGTQGVAIIANTYANGVTDGFTDVVNNGTIIGKIITTGTVTNNGTLSAGTLMSATSLVNHGTYSAGGAGTVGVTQHVGALDHAADGVTVIDVDALAAQKVDEIVVRGDVSMAGAVLPLAARLLPGSYRYLTVEEGSGRLRHAATIAQGVVFGWRQATTANSVAMIPTPDFRPAGVGSAPADAAFTDYLDRSWQAADRGLAGLFGYLSQLPTAQSYANWLGTVSGTPLTIPAQLLLQGGDATLGSVLGCAEFAGAGTLLREDACVWASVGAGKARQDPTANNPGYHASDTVVRLGGQLQVAPSWYVAGSFGYSRGSASATAYSADLDSYALAASLKYVSGPWELAGALALSYGTADNRRTIDAPGAGTFAAEQGTATSTAHAYQVGLRLRAAWELPLGDAYLRPYADLDVLSTRVPGFSESGTALALAVQGTTQTRVAFSPMLQVGARYDFDGGVTLRPYASLGASLLSDDSVGLDATLAAASGAGGTFRIAAQVPRTLGNAEVGLHLYGKDRLELKAFYGARFGSGFLAQGGSLRLSTSF